MSYKEISEWFYLNDAEIELLFTNWLKDETISISTKLKCIVLGQFRYIHKPYRKLENKHRDGELSLTSDSIRNIFNIISDKGITFEIYDKSPFESPWHSRLFGIDCVYKGEYKIQSMLNLPWWVE